MKAKSALQTPGAARHTGFTERQARIGLANEESLALLLKIKDLDLDPAAAYIRKHPPSAEVIATIAFLAASIERKLRAQQASKAPRKKKSLKEKLKDSGCDNYATLRAREKAEKTPTQERITANYSRGSIQNQFSALKNEQE